jgi:hypothetical protein
MRTSDPDDAIFRLTYSVPQSLNLALKAKKLAVLRLCLYA